MFEKYKISLEWFDEMVLPLSQRLLFVTKMCITPWLLVVYDIF